MGFMKRRLMEIEDGYFEEIADAIEEGMSFDTLLDIAIDIMPFEIECHYSINDIKEIAFEIYSER